MTPLLVGFALLLILAALTMRRSTGLPWKRISASDTLAWRRAERPLIAQRYGLVGRPDYVIEVGQKLIPVEVKPGRRASEPYAADVMQVAAYCLLVEETTGSRPPYGLLRYAEATFEVRWSKRLREELIGVLGEMRRAERRVSARRSHREAARCRGCGFFRQCDEAIR